MTTQLKLAFSQDAPMPLPSVSVFERALELNGLESKWEAYQECAARHGGSLREARFTLIETASAAITQHALFTNLDAASAVPTKQGFDEFPLLVGHQNRSSSLLIWTRAGAAKVTITKNKLVSQRS